MQVELLKSEHDAVLSLFKSANPAFNKLAALLLYLTEQLRDIWSQVNGAFVGRLVTTAQDRVTDLMLLAMQSRPH